MKLPNAKLAVVDREKIIGYLLNAAHPDNGGKASFFAACGFLPHRWNEMSAAVNQLAFSGKVISSIQSVHGIKFVVDGHLSTPHGNKAYVRTVWIIDTGKKVPRLVTAYPAKD